MFLLIFNRNKKSLFMYLPVVVCHELHKCEVLRRDALAELFLIYTS